MIQQRKWTLVALALFAAGSGLFCGSPVAQDAAHASGGPSGSASGEVAAKLGDQQITMAELDELVKQRNAKAYQAFYDARREVLDMVITERLFQNEADARGVSQQQLQDEVTKDVAKVTDAEIEAFYNAQISRMGGRSLDQMREQIRRHLQSTKDSPVLLAFLDDLKQKKGVKILLEPPRIEVKIAENDPSKGPKDAPILLVEYSDFQ